MSEVYELSQEEWDNLARKQLNKLGISRKELERRVKQNEYTVEEFKTYMVVHPSTIE